MVRSASGSDVPLMNVSEYLEHLFALGVRESDFPEIQPLFQHRIWERMQPGDGPERLEEVIKELRAADDRFHMEGGSWTNDLSWVRGYENVLGPMEEASSLFNETRPQARHADQRAPLPQRPVPPDVPPRPVATATGARGCGPTTGARSAAGPATSSATITPEAQAVAPGGGAPEGGRSPGGRGALGRCSKLGVAPRTLFQTRL